MIDLKRWDPVTCIHPMGVEETYVEAISQDVFLSVGGTKYYEEDEHVKWVRGHGHGVWVFLAMDSAEALLR